MKRYLTMVVACGAVAAGFLGAPAGAQAQGTCGEVGIWNASASARSLRQVHTSEVLGYVAWGGWRAQCWENGQLVERDASQHTSLHMRRGSYCLETVAQRWSFGLLRMYGYDCGASGNANIHDIWNYGSEWMRLYQSSGGTSTSFAHWYYRYDTNQWIYLGNTNTCCRGLYTWLESSGYNDSIPHGTYFRDFKETRMDGSMGTANYPCPETEDFDAHQEEYPQVYAADTDFRPDNNNTCR